MIIHPLILGIDISKHVLDLYNAASQKASQITNTPDAIASWFEPLKDSSCLVVFEATGPYDKSLITELDRAGLDYARVNPSRARYFAKATGALAKTDRLDAKMLAQMGHALDLEPSRGRDSDREQLRSLANRRDQLVAMRAQEKNRASEDPLSDQLSSITTHIEWLSKEIKTIERKIKDLVHASKPLKQEAGLLQSIPGIGPVAATTLLALMPELGQATRRGIAALAGLAPINKDSGLMRGKRIIQAGRGRVRRALYMAALHAAREGSPFHAFYKSLINRGKAKKQALVAVARKLLTIANAMIKNKEPFRA